MTPDAFIAKYSNLKGGGERATYQMFFTELCIMLGVPTPDAGGGGELGNYQFEGPVRSEAVFGGRGTKRIDLYKRNCFILEAKQSQEGYSDTNAPDDDALETVTDLFGNAIGTAARSGKRKPRYDRFMADARLQAERYAHGLPDDHKSPPFLIVADIGRSFELYFDYGGNGRGYRFYPDQQSYRIPFADLAEERVRDLLRDIWTTPEVRDPTRIAADVTRDIAHRLAAVGKFLEAEERRRNPDVSPLRTEATALFLMRILFCMFAEDVGLLPENSFKSLLEDAETKSPEWWRSQLDSLWKAMDSPDRENRYWVHADHRVRHFNGNLFSNRQAFQLDSGMIGHLVAAARCNWRAVEPAIFGTLLEQVLEGADRAKLGAHYTPRAYVQRLVNATISEVIDAEWAEVRDIVDRAVAAGDDAAATATVTAFHGRLAALRILDPACGTGNFLYVALEYLLRLESEVIELAAGLGTTLAPAVHPRQLLGLELNERAAVIAELVLWIGWLRHRLANHPEAIDDPVLPTLDTINFGTHGGYDAVLRRDASGGYDTASPTIPAWPDAEFIIGNPPFIGGKDMRSRLDDHWPGYAEALWKANPRVPPSADFVMQWWDRAAHILTAENSPLIRFGFVTTNSITQTFSRRVIENYLAPPLSPLAGEGGAAPAAEGEGVRSNSTATATAAADPSPDPSGHPLPQGERGLSLLLAIPDHPWTKATPDAAAVRIAMTVAARGQHDGRLIEITGERDLDTDSPVLEERMSEGRINPDLKTGADLTKVAALKANKGVCHDGVKLHGKGFAITARHAQDLGLGQRSGLEAHIRPYRNGHDLTGRNPREVEGKFVIDLFGLDEHEVRRNFPEIYQYLLETVHAARAAQAKKSPTSDALAYLEKWWLMGKPRPELRPAISGLPRYIGTVDTAKHRVFQFIPIHFICDDKVVIIAAGDAFTLGVLSSGVHFAWTKAKGGLLEDRPVYVKTACFDPYPFPDPTPEQRAAIADLAEELDSQRKAALAENDRLTMTEIYNLREAIRSGTTDEDIVRRARNARAGIVDQLHQRLDAEVAGAYGWPAGLPPAEIVSRLVALNAERAAEEAAGHIRWLRPDYQRPRFGQAASGG